MKIAVILVPCEEGGFMTYVPSLPGCISEGETEEEAMANIREAFELYVEPSPGNFIPEEDNATIRLLTLDWTPEPIAPSAANGSSFGSAPHPARMMEPD